MMKMAKHTLKILRCSHRKGLKVCFTGFHYYAKMCKSSQTSGKVFEKFKKSPGRTFYFAQKLKLSIKDFFSKCDQISWQQRRVL